MLVTTTISLFFAIWSSVFLIDHYLRAFNLKCYVQFVKRIGLNVSFLQLRFYTYRQDESGGLGDGVSASIPSWMDRLRASRLMSLWLLCGSTMALVSLCGMTLYLSKNLLDEVYAIVIANPFPIHSALSRSSSVQIPTTPVQVTAATGNTGLTPVVPGINLPLWHLPLFVGVCVLAGVIHELGHAMAAVHSNVPVSGFGIFLLAIYPGAFTEIDTDALKRSTPAQKMRIFGAGIWYNLVLALFGYLLFISSPILLSPLYSRGDGVLITRVSKDSGLSGAAGLDRGDVVYAINSCPTPTIRTWFACVDQLKNKQLPGYCVPSADVLPHVATQVKWLASGELHCCDDNSSAVSASHMCFQIGGPPNLPGVPFNPSWGWKEPHYPTGGRKEPPLGRSKVPRLAESLGLQQLKSHVENNAKSEFDSQLKGGGIEPQHSCLMARFVTDQKECEDNSHCDHFATDKSASICVYPALFNGTSLLRLFTRQSPKPVLFVGNIDELVYYVELSDLVPRLALIPLWIPSLVELFAKYLVTFSLAMALLNAVPCYGLDGHFMSSTIVDSLFSHCSPSRRRRLSTSVLYYGTFVLSSNLILSFFRFFAQHFKWSLI